MSSHEERKSQEIALCFNDKRRHRSLIGHQARTFDFQVSTSGIPPRTVLRGSTRLSLHSDIFPPVTGQGALKSNKGQLWHTFSLIFDSHKRYSGLPAALIYFLSRLGVIACTTAYTSEDNFELSPNSNFKYQAVLLNPISQKSPYFI